METLIGSPFDVRFVPKGDIAMGLSPHSVVAEIRTKRPV
jgi:hypothetical protein